MADAYALLPPRMNSREASVEVLAIGLQEGRLKHRRQLPRRPGGPWGPANGLWQFERGGGVTGVLTHPATRIHALRLCAARKVTPTPHTVHLALITDDVLAAGFARLNLWWLPSALPAIGDAAEGWRQYLEAWRPGSPHPDTWPEFYDEAVGAVGCAND